jgi:UDP-N-acetylmuramate dehydrogenase
VGSSRNSDGAGRKRAQGRRASDRSCTNDNSRTKDRSRTKDESHAAREALRGELPGLQEAVPLAPYTAYRVGGPAELLYEARSDEDLLHAVAAGSQLGLTVTVLGQATNVLIGDGGLPGLVVLARNAIATVRDDLLSAGAGAVLSTVVLDLAGRGLAGLEFAGNIPGSVGGAVVGNAGAYGRCIANLLVDADLALPNGERLIVPPERLAFSYRSSALKRGSNPPQPPRDSAEPHGVDRHATVLSARFRLWPGRRSDLLDEIARDAQLRRSKHPLEYASCGSYFKNPSSERPAARYIQDAGLKGLTVGRAQVSERHANFLVALDGACAADILALAAEVKRRVLEEFGVQLEEEVVHLGTD